ncbi:MAG: VCBS repeat-containing protein [Myxococcota bacterium]|nr:VCBS repeat-containing protein [Myxococcota bacterium]
MIASVSLLAVGCNSKDLVPDSPVAPDAAVATEDSGTTTTEVDSGVVTSTFTDAGMMFPSDSGVIIDASNPACEVPLMRLSPQTAILALDTLVIQIEGGSGNYAFNFQENQSGAILNQVSGQYVAGTNSGVVDSILVSDAECEEELLVSIRVVKPMDVRPGNLTVPRGAVFQFEVYEGSGSFSFELLNQLSTSTLTPGGDYIASQNLRTDQIQVTDQETFEVVDVFVTIAEGVNIEPDTDQVYVALGSRYALSVTGGSGWFDLTSSSNAVNIENEVELVGNTPGKSVVSVVDRYLNGVTTSVSVDVVAPHTFTTTRAGDYVRLSKIVAPGDLDGDGFADVVVGIADVDVNDYNSGAILVYPGGPNGLSQYPAQFFSSNSHEGRMGYGYVVEDFDNDGQKDLLAATPLANLDEAQRYGRVSLHRGVANGFFEPEPAQSWVGEFSYDAFGQSVTACDFNGDGLLDFAVSSLYGEDTSASPIRYSSGLTSIFLGRPAGFLEKPDVQVGGQVFDVGSGFSGFSDLQMGNYIDSGDFDGDGLCDLVTASFYYRSPNGGNRNGLIYVHKGRASTSSDFGGVSALPEIGFRSGQVGQTNSYFARYLSMADLNQDGKVDIIASEQDHTSGGVNRRGAVRVFAGRTLQNEPLTDLIWSDQADFSVYGARNDDRLGYVVGSGDYNSDGLVDLLAFAFQGERRNGPVNAGGIFGFAGQPGEWPSSVPTATIAPGQSYDRFGHAFALTNDLDGDGENDFVVYAPESDFHGLSAGDVYVVSGTTSPTREVLFIPAWNPSGDQMGHGVSILDDVNGDGYADMLAGAPYVNSRSRGTSIGTGSIYFGGPSGFSLDPDVTLEGFRRHSGGDLFGWKTAKVGDFDRARDPLFSGDYAMVGLLEDAPSSFNSNSYVLDGTCPSGSRTDAGLLAIWSGSSSGNLSSEPAFMFFGPQTRGRIRHVLGGFNFNGDAYDDVVVGSLDWDFSSPNANNAGGLAFISGRPKDDSGKTIVICEEDLFIRGRRSNDYMARGLSVMGDLNGDGCDEIAVGAPRENAGRSDQGIVRIIFGFGGPGCPSDPEMVALASGVTNSRAGYALSGGMDVDGDTIPDLVVGAYNHYANGRTAGSARLISGAYIAGLPRISVTTDVTANNSHPFQDPASTLNNDLFGYVDREQFGAGVQLIRANAGATAKVVVGSIYGSLGGAPRSGGFRIYEYVQGVGFNPRPVAVFGGESENPWNRIGERFDWGFVGVRPMLVVGGIHGNGAGVDLGSVYTFDLSGL